MINLEFPLARLELIRSSRGRSLHWIRMAIPALAAVIVLYLVTKLKLRNARVKKALL